MQFSNTYAQLGPDFFQRILPTPVTSPSLLLWNADLAKQLNLPDDLLNNSDQQARIFSGNEMLEGSDSMALVYSGHQFGQLNPQLGDGRAHLLGELVDSSGVNLDIQLKGSGPTPYSRNGDGRCALGPALREFIMSEAMFYLGVSTTRCLAVVATGEQVYRETIKPGAVVTRVATSHIRVGTFVYFAAHRQFVPLAALLDYSVNRHYSEINAQLESGEVSNKAQAFLEAVMSQQIRLVVEWMRVGFIHGVMNTDNCAISGETIDFGPCAMMGAYDPKTVFSSIDTQGRYAFSNQPGIVLWNLSRLAESLLSLIDEDQKTAVTLAEQVLEQFTERYDTAYKAMMLAKLGLSVDVVIANDFIHTLLQSMQAQQLDYTQTFIDLQYSLTDDKLAVKLRKQLGAWYTQWRDMVGQEVDELEATKRIMQKYNPLVIPRNHHVEEVLAQCEKTGDVTTILEFLAVLRSPYSVLSNTAKYQGMAEHYDVNYQTFCGT